MPTHSLGISTSNENQQQDFTPYAAQSISRDDVEELVNACLDTS
ncbi:unnamed protein product, partial [Rotaria magnacalcarata]